MRRCFPFLLSLPLLAACSKEAGPLRLDFVGATGLTSSNRSVSAADTLITRAFATSEDLLTRLRITVTYEPQRNPVVYPAVASTYDPKTNPNDAPLVYMDSVVALNKEFAFRNRFGARTTSGSERWDYTITDAAGRSVTRTYRITVRNTDSLSVNHGYTLTARTTERNTQARPYLLLRSGLRLPRHAVEKMPDNQALIDAIIVSGSDGVRLVAPAAGSLAATTPYWTARRRRTHFMRVDLTNAAFLGISTAAALRSAFEGGTAYTPDSLSTGPLLKDTVLAFATADGADTKYGLLYVNALVETPYPGITFAVRVQK